MAKRDAIYLPVDVQLPCAICSRYMCWLCPDFCNTNSQSTSLQYVLCWSAVYRLAHALLLAKAVLVVDKHSGQRSVVWCRLAWHLVAFCVAIRTALHSPPRSSAPSTSVVLHVHHCVATPHTRVAVKLTVLQNSPISPSARISSNV